MLGRVFAQSQSQAALAGLRRHGRLGYPTAFGCPPVQYPTPGGELNTLVCKIVPTLVPGALPIEAVQRVGRLGSGEGGRIGVLFGVGLLGLGQHRPHPIRQPVPGVAVAANPANWPGDRPSHRLDVLAQGVATLPHPRRQPRLTHQLRDRCSRQFRYPRLVVDTEFLQLRL